jgi:Tetratricopeptide repeat
MEIVCSTLSRIRRLDEALHINREVLERDRELYGDIHPRVLSALEHLAFILWQKRELEEAAEMQQGVLQQRQGILGRAHPDTLESMSRLAVIFDGLDRLAEAAPLRRSVKEIKSRKREIEAQDAVSNTEKYYVT